MVPAIFYLAFRMENISILNTYCRGRWTEERHKDLHKDLLSLYDDLRSRLEEL